MEIRLFFLLVLGAVFSAASVAHRGDKYVTNRYGNKDHLHEVVAKLASTLLTLIHQKNNHNSNGYHYSAPITRYQSLDGGLPSLNPFLIHKNNNIYQKLRSGRQENEAVDEFTSNSIDDFLLTTALREADNPSYGVKDFLKDVMEELLPTLQERGNIDSDEAIFEIHVENNGSGNKKKVFSKNIPNALINNKTNYEDLSAIRLSARGRNKYDHAYDGYEIQDINSQELSLAKDAKMIYTQHGKGSHWGGYDSDYIDSKNKNSILNKKISKTPHKFIINNKYKWDPDVKADTSEISREFNNDKMNGGSYEGSYKNSNWSHLHQLESNKNKHKSYTYEDYLNKYINSYSNNIYEDKRNSNSKNKFIDNLKDQYISYKPYLSNYDLLHPQSKVEKRLPKKINPARVYDANYFNDNYQKYYYGNQLANNQLAGNYNYDHNSPANVYYDSQLHSDKKYLGGKKLGKYYDPYINKQYSTEKKSLEVSDSNYNAYAQKLYDGYKDKYNKPNYLDTELQSLKKKVKVNESRGDDEYKSFAKHESGKIPDGYELLGSYNEDQTNIIRFENPEPPKSHRKDTIRSRESDVGKLNYKEIPYYEEVKNDTYEEIQSVYKEKTKNKKDKRCHKCKHSPILEGVFAFRYKPAGKEGSISIKSDTNGKPNITVELKENAVVKRKRMKETDGVKRKRAVEKSQDYQHHQPNTRRYGYTGGGVSDYNTYEYVDEAQYAPYARTYGWSS